MENGIIKQNFVNINRCILEFNVMNKRKIIIYTFVVIIVLGGIFFVDSMNNQNNQKNFPSINDVGPFSDK